MAYIDRNGKIHGQPPEPNKRSNFVGPNNCSNCQILNNEIARLTRDNEALTSERERLSVAARAAEARVTDLQSIMRREYTGIEELVDGIIGMCSTKAYFHMDVAIDESLKKADARNRIQAYFARILSYEKPPDETTEDVARDWPI